MLAVARVECSIVCYLPNVVDKAVKRVVAALLESSSFDKIVHDVISIVLTAALTASSSVLKSLAAPEPLTL
jgi:hypothetical protein